MPPNYNPYQDDYASKKYRTYDERAVRYRLAADMLILYMGFDENSSLLDIGGGADAEMEKCLREEYGWKGRYVNWDIAVENRKIEYLLGANHDPPHYKSVYSDYVTCLEVIEHFDPDTSIDLVEKMPKWARHGAVLSTPNAKVQNIHDMDETHLCGWTPGALELRDWTTEKHMLYDGFYSKGELDGIMAYNTHVTARTTRAKYALIEATLTA